MEDGSFHSKNFFKILNQHRNLPIQRKTQWLDYRSINLLNKAHSLNLNILTIRIITFRKICSKRNS